MGNHTRKTTDKVFRSVDEELRALYDFARLVTQQPSLQDVYSAAIELLIGTVKLDTALIFIREEDNLILRASGPADHTHSLEDTPVHHKGVCLCGISSESRQSIFVDDIHKDARCVLDECKEAGFSSFAAIPLMVGEEHIGVLGVASFEKRDFSCCSTFLETAANHLAISIHNAALLEQAHAYDAQLRQTNADREHALKALKENERRLSTVFSAISDAIWEWNLETDETYFSPRWYEMLGYDDREFPTHFETWKRLCHPDDYPAALEKIRNALDSGGKIAYRAEFRLLRKDGSWMWILGRGNVTERDSDGNPIMMMGIHTDISERKAVDAILLQQKNDYQGILDSIPDVVWYLDSDIRIIKANKATSKLIPMSVEDVLGKTMRDIFLHDHAVLYSGIAREVLTTGIPKMGIGEKFITSAGDTRWIYADVIPYKDIRDAIIGVIVIIRDITDLKKAEAALSESEKRYRSLFENSSDAILISDGTAIIDCNDMAVKMFHRPKEDMLGKHPASCSPQYQPDGTMSSEKAGEYFASVMKGNRTFYEWRFCYPDGTGFDAEVSVNRILEDGNVILLQSSIRDVTERKKTEEALRSSEAMLRSIYRTVPLGITALSTDRVFLSANDGMVDIVGYSIEEMIGRNTRFLYFNDEDYDIVGRQIYERSRLSRVLSVETRMRRKDGKEIYVILSASPIQTDIQDNRLVFAIMDITNHKRLEEQFLQAQKMEAIGQLAGGVAHDFNNILLVIMGYTDLVISALADDDDNRPLLGEVRSAAERAASLTRQLLAFSRRQVLELEPLDINEVVENLMKMLRRLIGENIELVIKPGHNLLTINADRGQMEQVLLNLCVNARDAMPEGGRLIIETDNIVFDDEYCTAHEWAKPGEHVLLSVTDSGIGMDETIIRQIFDPFFTTKETGKGTGLGLATVYGIVRQHGGMIQVYSEPGKGSRFKVYLPSSATAAASAESEARVKVAGGTETILLAEDEGAIRVLAGRILKDAGYTVITAADGDEAIRVYSEKESTIDLMILDVVMPRKGGIEVYQAISETQNDPKCLFTSGYSQNVVDMNFLTNPDERKPGTRLLQKPYSNTELLRTVREVLDNIEPHDKK